MAKNMNSTAYRKLDVDALDEDKFEEGEEQTTGGAGTGTDDQKIIGLLHSGKNIEALKLSLANPPFASKDQALKDRTTTLVAKVLQTFKNSEIEGVLSNLNELEVHALLKFVYRSFDLIGEAALCQALLAWHAQIVSKYGVGSIQRVFCDRKVL